MTPFYEQTLDIPPAEDSPYREAWAQRKRQEAIHHREAQMRAHGTELELRGHPGVKAMKHHYIGDTIRLNVLIRKQSMLRPPNPEDMHQPLPIERVEYRFAYAVGPSNEVEDVWYQNAQAAIDVDEIKWGRFR